MKWIYTWLLPLVFENKLLKPLDGYKTKIGRLVQAASAIMLVVGQQFPELPYFGQVNTLLTFLAGYFVTEMGLQHKVSKENRGL